jgi:hypothetical protein
MHFQILSKLSSSSSSRPLQDVVACKICPGELPSGFGACPLPLQIHKPHGFADLSWNFVTKCCKFPVKQLLSALPTRTNSSASPKKNLMTLLSGTAFLQPNAYLIIIIIIITISHSRIFSKRRV